MTERCAIHPERLAEITCARCGSFACYECVGASADPICARCRLRMGGGQDRAAQLRLVGGLTLANGILIALFGAVYVLLAGLWPFLPDSAGSDDSSPLLLGAFFGCYGLVHLLPGVLQIIAGVRLMRFRGRRFGLIALWSGLATVLGCYCTPTSIALLVYGLITLNDPGVKARLEEEGEPS